MYVCMYMNIYICVSMCTYIICIWLDVGTYVSKHCFVCIYKCMYVDKDV